MSTSDLDAFGTPACALAVDTQVFRFSRQGGNDACADCGSQVNVDWISMSALPSVLSAPPVASAAAAASSAEARSRTDSAAALQLAASNAHRWTVTLCPACAGVHRSLGTAVCQVRRSLLCLGVRAIPVLNLCAPCHLRRCARCPWTRGRPKWCTARSCAVRIMCL